MEFFRIFSKSFANGFTGSGCKKLVTGKGSIKCIPFVSIGDINDK